MSLQFPNASRVYDGIRHCVTFWGHDSTFEIAFHVDEEALRRFNPHESRGETASLRAFDGNRRQIERAAISVYGRQRKNSLHLSASDF